MIQVRALELVRTEENFEENDNNKQGITKNISEEEGTRIMKLRFEKILHTRTASEKKIDRVADKLEKGAAKIEIDKENNYWRNTLAILTTFVQQ